MTGLLGRQVRRRQRQRERFAQASASENAPARLAPNMITTIIEAQDRIPDRGRISDEYMHLSSLIGACPRAQVIARDTGMEIRSSVTGPMRIMWKIGRAVETHIRDSYINAVNYEGVYGRWRCDCHYTQYTGLFDADYDACHRCGYQPRFYEELTVFDDDANIGGNPDLALLIAQKYLIIEIKSMNKEGFDALERPVPDHVLQAGGYRRLYERMGLPVHDEVVIIYVRKDYNPRVRPYKEMRVNLARDTAVQVSLDLMWDHARAIKFGTLQDLPARICDEPQHTRACNCFCVVDCFQRS